MTTVDCQREKGEGERERRRGEKVSDSPEEGDFAKSGRVSHNSWTMLGNFYISSLQQVKFRESVLEACG